MPNINRTDATEAQVAEARVERFGASYGFNDGELLIVEKVGLISHVVDGKTAKYASPVIFLKSGSVIYIRSLIKERVTYRGEIVPIRGTLNLLVASLVGKTVGEVLDLLNARLVGKTLRALRLTYQGVDRNGEVRTISYNAYDIVELLSQTLACL